MARKSRLTRRLIGAIVERIREGSFPYIAAGSFGIPKSSFYGWMARGEEDETRSIYWELWDRVSEAMATARHAAETRVFQESPLSWLRLGPGREAWCEKAEIDLRGQIMHNGTVGFEVPINHKTLAEAMVMAEELGLILPGPMLKRLVGRADDDDVLDGESTTALLTHEESDAQSEKQSGPGGSNGNGRAGR